MVTIQMHAKTASLSLLANVGELGLTGHHALDARCIVCCNVDVYVGDAGIAGRAPVFRRAKVRPQNSARLESSPCVMRRMRPSGEAKCLRTGFKRRAMH